MQTFSSQNAPKMARKFVHTSLATNLPVSLLAMMWSANIGQRFSVVINTYNGKNLNANWNNYLFLRGGYRWLGSVIFKEKIVWFKTLTFNTSFKKPRVQKLCACVKSIYLRLPNANELNP